MSDKTKKWLISRLAVADLIHEWILNLCMILALAAVLAPLLLLLGLKHGTISTLRDRLVEDPVNREIKPAQTRNYKEHLFTELNQREDVGFLIPTIMRGASIVKVINPKNNKRDRLDIIPTKEGDPLILENGGRIPGRDEAILSTAAAEELGIKTGQKIKIKIGRSRNGRREIQTVNMIVAAILNPRADALARIYMTSQFVLDVEAYRAGHAVMGRGWPGGQPRPYHSFDGFALVAPTPISRIAQRRLAINTGISHVMKMSEETYHKKVGFPLPKGWVSYWLYAKGNTLQPSVIKRLKNKLRGSDGILLPVVEKYNLVIKSTNNVIRVVGISLSKEDSTRLGIPPVPWGQYDRGTSDARMAQILLPVSSKPNNKGSVYTAKIIDGEINFPLVSVGNNMEAHAIAPLELIAVLRTGKERKIKFDENIQGFLDARAGYRGFRLYARSIDDVVPLYRRFIELDIPVITQMQAIERVRTLDRGLTRIFWLVAVVGIAGGIAALLANLYAAVERKTKELGVMRLMGISRLSIFRFPVYQGTLIALFSVIVAFIGYLTLASVINQVFASDLNLGQKICELPSSYFIYTIVLTLVASAGSSIAAAWKATKIEPAEAIRVE